MILRTAQEIRDLFERWRSGRRRTIVAIDHSNVRRWQDRLSWEVSIADLGRMAASFASNRSLHRFYCAADFGPDWHSMDLQPHSLELITAATACAPACRSMAARCSWSETPSPCLGVEMRKYAKYPLIRRRRKGGQ